jgi:HK97 gp10 family phage protein
MPPPIAVKVEGLAELQAKFDQTPKKLARAIMRRALTASAEVLRREMIDRVRRHTGFLAEHMGLKLRLARDELAGTASVGPLQDPYPFVERPAETPSRSRKPVHARQHKTITAATVARFLEFGTRKMPMFPFIRQSFESRKDAALDAFVAEARNRFDEVVR